MTRPLMPKATAIWLIENTALSFEQIAAFCELHILEIQAIADGDVGHGIVGMNPVHGGQLSKEDIERCEKDPSAALKLIVQADASSILGKKKRAKYTPMAKRADRPDAIAWVLKNYPDVPDARLVKLLSTTKAMIASVRERTHWNSANIKPKDPVLLGLCSQEELSKLIAEFERKVEKS